MNEPSDHVLSRLPPDQAMQAEDRLWWVKGRMAIIDRYLRQAMARQTISDIVDVGCGSGGNLATLARYGSVTGIEPVPSLAEAARRRGVARQIVEEDISSHALRHTADLITLFDVLEHIENEHDFLARFQHLGRPGHLLLISVPASPWLYGRHDELLNHYRRYSRRHLIRVLQHAGYEVLDCRPFMFFLYPLAVASRMSERIRTMAGHPPDKVNTGEVSGIAATLFERMLAFESRLGFGPRFPCGLWMFALAKSL
jgi:SAM-dependent methyltransferase